MSSRTTELASMMAARSVHSSGVAVSQMPSPGLASTASVVLFTVKCKGPAAMTKGPMWTVDVQLSARSTVRRWNHQLPSARTGLVR